MYAAVSLIKLNYRLFVVFLVSFLLLIFLLMFILRCAKKYLESIDFLTATVEVYDNNILHPLMIYLLPLITQNLDNYNWIVWILVTCIICIFVTISYGYYFNPLLIFFRYHFYKVAEKNGIPHVLITDRRIYRTGEELDVICLSKYVLIEKNSDRLKNL